MRVHLLNKVKTSTIDFNFFINQLQNAYLSLRMCWLPSKVHMYVCIYINIYRCKAGRFFTTEPPGKAICVYM